jgi:hypothetical protein
METSLMIKMLAHQLLGGVRVAKVWAALVQLKQPNADPNTVRRLPKIRRADVLLAVSNLVARQR